MQNQKHRPDLPVTSPIALCAFAFFGFGVWAYADAEIITPFELGLRTKALNAILDAQMNAQAEASAGIFGPGLSGSGHATVPDIALTDPFDVKISGIQLTMSYSFLPPVRDGSPWDWRLISDQITGEIRVAEVRATQDIIKVVNGVTFVIHLDGRCTDVRLVLAPGLASAHARIHTSLANGNLDFALNGFEAEWSPLAWQVASMQCTGSQGFDRLIAQAAEKQLKSIRPFLEKIEDEVRSKLAEISGKSVIFSFTVPSPLSSAGPIQVKVSQVQVKGEEGVGYVLRGAATLEIPGAAHRCSRDLIAEGQTLSERSDFSSSLAIPFEAVRAALTCAYTGGVFQAVVGGEVIPAIDQIKKSWFARTWVWPDLSHFKQSSDFIFSGRLTGSPAWMGVREIRPGVLSGLFSAPLAVDVQALRDGELQPYLALSTAITPAPGEVSLKNGVLSFRVAPASLQLTKTWNPEYTSRYHPNQRLNTGTIGGHLAAAIAEQAWSVGLPPFEVAPGLKMSLKSWSLEWPQLRVDILTQE